MTLHEVVKQAERDQIIKVLRMHIGAGRMERVAKALGIHRKTLWSKIREHGIDKSLESPQLPIDLVLSA